MLLHILFDLREGTRTALTFVPTYSRPIGLGIRNIFGGTIRGHHQPEAKQEGSGRVRLG